MVVRGGQWADLFEVPLFIPLVLLLVAIRFVASTVIAYAGIQGMDTRGLDAAIEIYSYALLFVLFSLVVGLLATKGEVRLRAPRFLLFLGLVIAAALQWLGTVDASLRLVGGSLGPWADFLLGATATSALVTFTTLLAAQLHRYRIPSVALQGFQALGYGYAVAYGLRSLRLLDYGYLFGLNAPSGLLWLFDFGPSLLLVVLVLPFWIRFGISGATDSRTRVLILALPVLGAMVGLSVALGVIGGFVLSNALAWGGSYLVFSPTSVSLTVMGFGIGAFLAIAWALRKRMPRMAWKLIFGGVSIAALAGIQTSAGLLGSFAGLLAGIVCAAWGLAILAGSPSPEPGIGPRI